MHNIITPSPEIKLDPYLSSLPDNEFQKFILGRCEVLQAEIQQLRAQLQVRQTRWNDAYTGD